MRILIESKKEKNGHVGWTFIADVEKKDFFNMCTVLGHLELASVIQRQFMVEDYNMKLKKFRKKTNEAKP